MTGAPAITGRLGGSTTTLAGAIPAQDRTIPVDEPWGAMLPTGGLQRGRVVGCDGPAAVTVAASLVAGATRAGSWVLLLGASMIGLEALAEVGVRLDRVVAVEVDAGPTSWAERAVAAADGFELIVTVPPSGAGRVERQVRQRLHARGTVLVPVGVAGHTIGCDVAVTTAAPRWVGIGPGHGRLVARQVDVVVGGRRVPRPVRRTLWLPGPDGRVRDADTAPGATPDTGPDAVSELLVG